MIPQYDVIDDPALYYETHYRMMYNSQVYAGKSPSEAYAYAEKALVMLSNALNKGMGKMEIIQETSEQIENNFFKHLNKLNEREI